MKPAAPHDPFDKLMMAALNGDLTPDERAQFDSRINQDPAAHAAYQEAQAMHDLLEKTHRNAQPDDAFEQRMVSGVRRKLQTEKHPETGLESVRVIWTGIRDFVTRKRNPIVPGLGVILAIGVIIFMLVGVSLGPITAGIKQAKGSAEMQQRQQMELAEAAKVSKVDDLQAKGVFSTITSQLADANGAPDEVPSSPKPAATPPSRLAVIEKNENRYREQLRTNPDDQNAARHLAQLDAVKQKLIAMNGTDKQLDLKKEVEQQGNNYAATATAGKTISGYDDSSYTQQFAGRNAVPDSAKSAPIEAATTAPAVMTEAPSVTTQNGMKSETNPVTEFAVTNSATAQEPAAVDNRKLIRNAQLDLEVKSFQEATDKITAMTNAAGGYVDTSNSQKGGNGKLQGTIVVKVLPQNLDAFLLKLRDLGQVKNQSVSTDDVTKDYFDTQARLVNSQKMETQLQELLKRENGKVSDLLQVERELGRVRGEIEQMQGQLKLYDFQVQYATVTIQVAEKDLKQAAAYLLKEQDDFSLFATDVEDTFQKSRKAADDFKGQVLVATLNHNSGSDVSALLVVSVPPDQIEPFLAEIRGLGRVANFTRDTKRVAQDGGDSDQPADQTLTEKDKIMVNISIRSDDETRKQVAMTVVTKVVDDALDQAKSAALANPGVEILSSSLNKAPEGQSTAALSVRVPGKNYAALMESFRGLGRTASLSIQRNDNSGPGASGDDAPVIVSLSLTDDDTPLQQTEMSVVADDVDSQEKQIKNDAASAGVEVKASNFQRQPDGTEIAQMTFRLPMAKYPSFLESVKKLGKVESLSVHRDDRPDQTRTDDTAPAEISLQLHNQRDIVAENDGILATLRNTFADGAAALLGSVRVIGVAVAFIAPWVFTLGLLAWMGRRIYVWRKR